MFNESAMRCIADGFMNIHLPGHVVDLGHDIGPYVRFDDPNHVAEYFVITDPHDEWEMLEPIQRHPTKDKQEEVIDTKTLVVGQKVWMQSGDQFREATVEEITENYVRVFIAPSGPFTKWLPKMGEPPLGQVEFPYSPENQNGYSIDFRYDGSQCGRRVACGTLVPLARSD